MTQRILKPFIIINNEVPAMGANQNPRNIVLEDQDSYFIRLLYKGHEDASRHKPPSILRKEGTARVHIVNKYFGNVAKSITHKIPYFWSDASADRNGSWIMLTPNAHRDAIYDGYSSGSQCDICDVRTPQQYPIILNMMQMTKRDQLYSLEIELEYSMDNLGPLLALDF